MVRFIAIVESEEAKRGKGKKERKVGERIIT